MPSSMATTGVATLIPLVYLCWYCIRKAWGNFSAENVKYHIGKTKMVLPLWYQWFINAGIVSEMQEVIFLQKMSSIILAKPRWCQHLDIARCFVYASVVKDIVKYYISKTKLFSGVATLIPVVYRCWYCFINARGNFSAENVKYHTGKTKMVSLSWYC